MNRASVKSIGMLCVISVMLSACGVTGSFQGLKRQTDTAQTNEDVVKQPKNLGNITVADAGKVSDTELQQAVENSGTQPNQVLGTTIASLGLLDNSGFWMETPLVQTEVDGRVTYLKNGKSINLRLIPNGGVAGSGSQISVAAMQVLDIPIVELAELRVFKR